MTIPLQLIQSDIIPPAPTSAIKLFASDNNPSSFFIAYGASNLLVVSQFNSNNNFITNICNNNKESDFVVSSVSWSQNGDLAAVVGNCIGLFSLLHDCSFSWRQTAVLVQSTNVETITWTGSGDGIISGGLEVVFWRLRSRSWEIAWKFKSELPQNLIAATFSIKGPLATGHLSTLYSEASLSSVSEGSKNVSLFYPDGDLSFIKSELQHPMPVCMIQWRPLMGKQCKQEYSQTVRQVLLTCCLDGTVRLWCEINDAKVKRIGKDVHDRKNTKISFHVVAAIEINQTLKGTLGSDVFVKWATEIDAMAAAGKAAEIYFPGRRSEKTGSCEWLIAVGPNMRVTLWAIHCLDDVSPMRFPRVTLWIRREPMDSKSGIQGLLLNKVCILRNELFDPPKICSFVRLSPCNSLIWSQLYTPPSAIGKEEEPSNKTGKDNYLSGYTDGILNIDGHTGKVLQVAVHRYRLDIDLAASLDNDGLVFLWSFPTNCSSLVNMPTIYPTRKLSGKLWAEVSHPKYTGIMWAPSFSDEDTVLLAGHDQGIDCILIKILGKEEENLLCHKLCTIPFPSHSSSKGSTNLYPIPLPSNCKERFRLNHFLLLSIWDQGFQALSWKISIRSTASGTGFQNNNHDSEIAVGNSSLVFESDFVETRYHISVDSCSSVVPDPHKEDKVTSFAAVSPNISVFSEELNWASGNELHHDYCGYHMITGYENGNLKLWRSTSNSNLQWELVGMLATHHGPITLISLTDCGRKISTLCSRDSPNTSSTVHIWESVRIGGAGTFVLEDTLVFDKEVVSINWSTLGSGQLILGVCLQNELRVYAERRSDSQHLVKQGNSLGGDIWFCISFAHTCSVIRGFVWGRRAMAVVLFDRYFSFFSQWSFSAGDITQSKGYSGSGVDEFVSYDDGSNDSMHSEIYIGNYDCYNNGSADRHNGRELELPMKLNSTGDMLSSMSLARTLQKRDSSTMTTFLSLQDIVEKLHGTLAAYHPTALLTNIHSGHWKRAYASLCHLIEYSGSSSSIRNCCTKSSLVIPLVPLSNYVEGVLSTQRNEGIESASFSTSSLQPNGAANQFAFGWGADASSNTSNLGEVKLSDFISAVEMLLDKGIINNSEKMQILIIINLLHEIRNPTSAYESLDEPGRRFWVAARFQQMHFSGRYGTSVSAGNMVFGPELFAWALHSDCQENLYNYLLPQEPSWEDMRNIGVGFWYTNTSQLRIKMEKLARQQFLKRRDPKACALLYIALNRLQVLAGLFKISKDEKDKPLVGFLSRNFKEDKNKAAALKNAYVLMGKHQLDLAAAFFLLGGDASSAVNICAKSHGDEQLALVICRLLEGYSGPLEHQLISKYLLPAAVEKGDSWLASLLEWMLGNYAQSFMRMLGTEMHTPGISPTISSNQLSLLGPSIGQYCLMLATQNTMKNAVGEGNAAALGRWAIWISANALDRCGLPVEALECLSSSMGLFSCSDLGKLPDIEKLEVLNDFLVPHPNNSSCNWINGDVAFCMETHAKIGLAMKYVSKLLTEHPNWPASNMPSVGANRHFEHDPEQYHLLLENFQGKLTAGVSCLEQKFNLSPFYLINMIVCALSSNGLEFMMYHILHDYASQSSLSSKEAPSDSSLLYSINSKLLLRGTEEMCFLFSSFMRSCSLACSQLKTWFNHHNAAIENRSSWLAMWKFYVMGLQWSIWRLRTTIKLFSGSHAEELTRISSASIDLLEYCIYFGLAWLQRDFKSVILIMNSILDTSGNGHAADENNALDLKKLLHSIEKSLADNTLEDRMGNAALYTGSVDQPLTPIPSELKSHILWAASWKHVACFLNQQLSSLSGEPENHYSVRPFDKLSFSMSGMDKQLRLVPVVLAELLRTTCAQISSSCMKQFAAFLIQNRDDEFNACTLSWLEGSGESHSNPHQGLDKPEVVNVVDNSSAFELLWNFLADPKFIRDGLSEENFQWQQYIKPKSFKEWDEVYTSFVEERKAERRRTRISKTSSNSPSSETGSPAWGSSSPGRHSFVSSGLLKQLLIETVMPFQNPKEVYRIEGELVEALCVNSIDQNQAAIASNRKGIMYFNWDDELPTARGDYSNYVWAEADWPQKGWAGSVSTPVPTCVSPGVGLGSKKGKHLGLGGATIGSNPFGRPGKGVHGGGAYTRLDVSGLGWEVQEDFEDLLDPPATVNNISTKAFSSHPALPYFLAGSSNTHIYLWEFGKDKAVATYGVLPAANVPPPYALASISGVQFDKSGQRFATAALDGSICTWQLEVGGRSNIRPTESSLCFNNHASDVTYVTASGSIIAAAGHSSSGINVVIWDTLAPPSTSRASIMCHEGGALSLSVFDNDIGSGSISPFIVTGGKGGDVGLHDFRYIATGRTKKHKLFNMELDGNASFTADVDSRTGDRNRDGMLWYIPKAHSGSVTKICTIPNSSLFLTGSKDGDVKLWDAKTAKLVSHWPKLHEKHTFLQPSSRGFGGVVRAAVTDIQVISRGFLSCGGDGSVKLVQLKGSV